MTEETLFKDIKRIFDKTAEDKNDKQTLMPGIKPQLVELNDDFYVSVDIQGYCCFPKETENLNPLQYVVSMNPPLILANYSMCPL